MRIPFPNAIRRMGATAVCAAIVAAAALTPSASINLTFDSGLLVDGPNRGIGHEIGDFDEDGVPDVLTSSSNGTVTLMLGRGDGWFDLAAGWPKAVGGDNQNLVLGDFNHDDHLDAAVASRSTNEVHVLLGDGAGDVLSSTSYATGTHPFDIATADVNGDGHLDLVTANEANTTPSTAPTVSVLLGNGDGTFTAASPRDYVVGGAAAIARGVAIGDVTGDNKRDIVVVLTNSNLVRILAGGGDGTFALSPTSYATSGGPRKVALADFDEDGDLDIATADSGDGVPFDPANRNNKTTVLLNDGTGVFTPASGSPFITGAALSSPFAIRAADLDGDGHLDLVTVNRFSGSLSVLRGAGDGNFTAPIDVPYPEVTDAEATDVAVGDVNGDGRPDVIGNAAGTPGFLVLFRNTATIDPPVLVGTTPASPSNVATPTVSGTTDGALVALYTTNDCSGSPLGTGTRAEFEGAGITVTAAPDATSTYYATTTNAAGWATSSCSSTSVSYTYDATPPDAPTISSSSPSSPSIDTSPELLGIAEAGSMVRIYATPDCSGGAVAIGTAASFDSPGLTVGVGSPSFNTFSATATDPAGNMSLCSPSVTYDACTMNPVVTSTADTGAGTLRDAVGAACAGSTITFTATGTINLGSTGPVDLHRSVTIQGPGADQLTLRHDTPLDFPILQVRETSVASISGLTFADGKYDSGAGGAIYNEGGTVTVDRTAFVGNQAGAGGAVFNSIGSSLGQGTFTIRNSTFSDNTAITWGGAVLNGASTAGFTIVNSTFSHNSAKRHGGAIFIDGPNATITNATFTGNQADSDGDDDGVGGGIFVNVGQAPELRNTIVAGNLGNDTRDFCGELSGSSASNLIGDGTCMTGVSDGVQGNQVGTTEIPIDPRLGALAANGGPTKTHALLAGSPAIDAGDNSLTSETQDQRGHTRVLDGPDAGAVATIDIGAIEQDPWIEDIADQVVDEDGSLEVTFAAGDGTLAFDSIVATSGTPSIVPNANLTVTGSGSTQTLMLSPAANAFGTATITVTATRTIGGTAVTATDTFDVTVLPVGDQPLASDTTTLINTPTAPIVITPNAVDGAEIVWFRFSGITNGTLMLASGGSAFIDPAFVPVSSVVGGGGVIFTPAPNSTAPGQFTVQATRDGLGNGAGPGRTVTIGVDKHSTFTTVFSAPNPSPRLSNVTVTFQVFDTGGPTPTGTVQVTVAGSSETCAGSIFGNLGVATGSCQLSLADSGDRTITATYTGDTWSNPSSWTTVQTVDVCPKVPVVTNTNDSGAGSLRQAISDACASDTINFAIPGPGPDTITLSTALFITKHISLVGPTDKRVRISGGHTTTIAGVDFNAGLAIVNLTLMDGAGSEAGAIRSYGDLAIVNSTLSGNTSCCDASAITHLGNSLAIYNSTLSGNSSPEGGMTIRTSGPTTLMNTTVTANTDTKAVVFSNGTLTIQNSIVAGNGLQNVFASGNGVLNDLGNNLVDVDPMLGPLQNNGGPTFTHLPRANSPALDAGNTGAAASAGLTTDQRGVPRALAGPGATTATVDIGAAEARASLAFSDATILEDSGFNFIPFFVGDNSLITSVTATAPNTGVLPSGFGLLTVQGTGATRTLKVAGAPGMYGLVPITITVDTGAENVQGTLMLTIQPVADTPSVSNATTNEDTQTTAGLVIDRNDTDGFDVSHFKITGITNGTLFLHDGVTPIVNGDFITGAQGHAGLAFTPALNFFGTASFGVQASIGALDAGLGGAVVTATITVAPIADTPSVTDATTMEDMQTVGGFTLRIRPNPVDGVEVTHFQISAITGGTLFHDDGVTPIHDGDFLTPAQVNNSLTFTPAPDSFAAGHFTVRASIGATVAGLSPGGATATITIVPVADTPSVTSATTRAQKQTTSGLVIQRNAVDGPEVTHFKILGFSHGKVYLTDGVTAITSGDFITAAQGTAGLRFTPDDGFIGTASFAVQAATDATGGGISPATTATITVGKHDTTTTITSHTPNPSDSNLWLTVKYSVVSATGGPTPIGFVTVSIGAVSSTCLVSAPECVLTGLAPGAGQTLTVAYAGDALSSASTATAVHDVNGCPVNPVVTNTADSGPGSLRQALADACSSEAITFDIPGPGPHTITLTTGPLATAKDVWLQGPVDRQIRISGNHASRVLDFTGPSAQITHLTIMDGLADHGAGIRATGRLGVQVATLSGNVATVSGGAVMGDGPDSAITIFESTVSGNSAPVGSAVRADGIVGILYSTLTANTGGGAAVSNEGDSGAYNSIIAGNDGVAVVNTGIGTFANFAGNILTGDPKLGPLQNNGGPTFTHLPLSGSPAIDAGDGVLDAPPPFDQRGLERVTAGPAGVSKIDSGAVEAVPSVSAIAAAATAEDTPVPIPFSIGDAAIGFDSVVATSNDQTLLPNANLVVTGAAGSRTLTITPAANRSGTATITIAATSSVPDYYLLAPAAVTATSSFVLTVAPAADTPSITNATTIVNTQTTSGLVVSRNAVDGAEVTHVKVTGVSGGALFQNNGTTPIPSGSFITIAQGAAGLRFTPLAGSATTGHVSIQASTSATDAGLGGALVTADVLVTKLASTTTVVTSKTPANPGEAVTFTATVVPAAASGAVQFKDGSTLLGSPVTLVSGSASFTTSSLTPGSHVIAAVYGGNTLVLSSTGTVTQTVRTPVTLSIGSSGSPAPPGASVTISATPIHGASGVASGTMTFKEGATTLSTTTLSGGTASFTTSSFTLGVHHLTVEYGGDAAFAPGSGTFDQTTSCPVMTVGPATIPAAVIGASYAQTFTQSGGAGATAFSLTGALPAGLTFDIASATLSGAPQTPGTYPITVTATPANGCGAVTASYTLLVGGGRTVLAGADAGGVPVVRRFSALDGSAPTTGAVNEFFAFDPLFSGGVRVAEGDVNGDGQPDYIAAAGPGAPPQIKIFDGATGAVVRSFFAFEPAFTGGVFVAAGDVDGDGYADVIVGSGPGRSGQVRVFSGRDGTVLRDTAVFAPFTGGVHVAAGDVNGDGAADLVVGSGEGMPATVTVLSGRDLSVLSTFVPYGGFTGGAWVAAGDVTGDGFADVITGAGPGGGPHVHVFNGVTGADTFSFFAFSAGFSGGVRVAAGDVTGDGRAEIITGAGPGGAPEVRVFDGATAALVSTQMAYPEAFAGGVFVATAAPEHRMAIEMAGTTGVGGGPAGADRRPDMLAGWAFVENHRDAGISAVHVWALPLGGGEPVFVGVAAIGDERADIAARFGPQYGHAGFHLDIRSLPAGAYDIVVFAQSAQTGMFPIARVVRVIRTP